MHKGGIYALAEAMSEHRINTKGRTVMEWTQAMALCTIAACGLLATLVWVANRTDPRADKE